MVYMTKVHHPFDFWVCFKHSNFEILFILVSCFFLLHRYWIGGFKVCVASFCYHCIHFFIVSIIFSNTHDIDYNSKNSQHSTDHFSTYVELMKNKYTKKMFPFYLDRSEFSQPEHKTINLVLVDKEMVYNTTERIEFFRCI